MLEVSHVSDVADIAHLVAQMLEKLYEYIICHTWTGVSEVCVTVDGRTADIKSHVSFVDRLEDLFLSRKRIGYI